MNILVADKHQIVKYNTNVEKALKLKEKLKDIISLYQSRARIGVIKNRTFEFGFLFVKNFQDVKYHNIMISLYHKNKGTDNKSLKPLENQGALKFSIDNKSYIIYTLIMITQSYKENIYDETGIAGMIYNDSYYYYEKNVLGDVVAVLDINNNEVASYTYDAWGNVISQSGSMADKNPIRYRSYYYDTETGFYYLQSRYYDPSIRRFINADDHSIIGILSQSAGEINLYAYCGNNPVMNTDESGYFGLGALLAITLSSFIIGGIGQFVSNALAGKEGSELLRGVAGAAFGTAINSLLLCLAMPLGSLSFVLAAGASSLVQTGIDSLEAVIREEEFDWGQSMINLGVNFLSTLSGNILGAKLIKTNSGWFQPKKFLSVFTKSYGQKILMQTAIGGAVSGAVNYARTIGPIIFQMISRRITSSPIITI